MAHRAEPDQSAGQQGKRSGLRQGKSSVPYASCCSPFELMSASAGHSVTALIRGVGQVGIDVVYNVHRGARSHIVGYNSAQIAIWMADPMAFAAAGLAEPSNVLPRSIR